MMKEMLNRKQEQQVELGATAIQAGGDVIINSGLTVTDVKVLAMDVFRANFHELSGLAKETAGRRAEEITEQFLKKLQEINPDGLNKASDPDFQISLLTVQKEFARSGDENLGDLLVDMLIDRSECNTRDLMQLVLTESLQTVPKLTDNQIAALSIRFRLAHTETYGLKNDDLFGQFLDQNIEPFIKNIPQTDIEYRHLEFAGCGSISLASGELETILGTTYQGLFMKGFDKSETVQEVWEQVPKFIEQLILVPCLNDQTKFQISSTVTNQEKLAPWMDTLGAEDLLRNEITRLFDLRKMKGREVKEKCIGLRPYMDTLFKTWAETPLRSFNLTSVGMAIAHANIRKSLGEFADLSIWIK